MYIYSHVCISIYLYNFLYTHGFIYIYIYIYIYTQAYIGIYVHIIGIPSCLPVSHYI